MHYVMHQTNVLCDVHFTTHFAKTNISLKTYNVKCVFGEVLLVVWVFPCVIFVCMVVARGARRGE